MSSAAGGSGQSFRGGALIPILFFITPLFTAAAPRLAPFFLPIVAFVLIVVALRRGLPRRELVQPNAAMAALIAVELYAALSAIWAEAPESALSKAALLIAATLVVFAASAAIAVLDKDQVRSASLAFIAGALCAAGFVMTELLTDGALTRFAMNNIPAFKPDRAKHVAIHHGRVTKINLSEFNQHVAMLAFQLWPGFSRSGCLSHGAGSCSQSCSLSHWPCRSPSRSTIPRNLGSSPHCSSFRSPGSSHAPSSAGLPLPGALASCS